MFKRRVDPNHDLTVCVNCGADTTYPDMDESEPLERARWRVVLVCGSCGHCRETTAYQSQLHRFDAKLDRQRDAMARAADALAADVMASEVDTFIAALDAGAVMPEDFNR